MFNKILFQFCESFENIIIKIEILIGNTSMLVVKKRTLIGIPSFICYFSL